MTKPGFSPAIIVGVGEKGWALCTAVESMLKSWPVCLRNLVQFYRLEGTTGESEQIQEGINRLRAAHLLYQAGEMVSIRNYSGPLEINVYLLGNLSSELVKVLDELSRLSYAWQPEMGFTGATITTLGLVNDEYSQIEQIDGLLAVYQSEQFLDCFAGRIYLASDTTQEGSKLAWPDMLQALSYCLYLSTIPGDEPLLTTQLGLIRRDERKAKLATFGLKLFYAAGAQNLLQQSAKLMADKAKSMLDSKQEYEDKGAKFQLLSKLESGRKGLPHLEWLHSLQEDIKSITWGNVEATLQYVLRVEQKIKSIHEEIIQKHLPQAEIETKHTIIIEEDFPAKEGVTLRPGLILLMVLLDAGLYRMAASGLLPEWLAWGIGLGLVALWLVYIAAGTIAGKRQANMQRNIPLAPNEEHAEDWQSAAASLEELLRECRQVRHTLLGLARAWREIARELQDSEGQILSVPVESAVNGKEAEMSWLLPQNWRLMAGEEYREYVRRGVQERCSSGRDLSNQEVIEAWKRAAGNLKLQLLLQFRPGVKPLRRLHLLSLPPDAKVKGLSGVWRLVNGYDGCVLALELYIGLQTEALAANSSVNRLPV